MIFYFSGTGNSRFIARRLAKHFDDRVIEINKKNMAKTSTYKLSKDERVGIVCPVYWYNMPMLVEEFLSKLRLEGYDKNYIYAVVTYGNSSGNMLGQIEKVLSKRGYVLSGKYGIRMVDNYVVAYDLVNEDKQKQILVKAVQKCDTFMPYIEKRASVELTEKGMIAPLTPILKPFYTHANHTKKFRVTSSCVGCGKCERECPCQVITLKEGGPNWSGACSFCLRCIHSCPTKAIQYGKGTEKRRRYVMDFDEFFKYKAK